MNLHEWKKLTDKYLWMTAFIIASNAIRREYQNSFLGVVWTVILPLIQVMIFAIIMPMITARPVDNYPFYLVTSFPLWIFISTTLVHSCNAIISQAETIKRCMVSSIVFPIADTIKQFYTYVVSFLTMYAFCLVFYVDFDPVVLMLPLLLVPIFISVLAVSIALSYVAPYVRDVGYLLHMLTNILFWFTPVVYPLRLVPEQYQWFFWLNPVYVLMHPAQKLLFEHRLPDAGDMAGVFIVTAICVAVSLWLYRLCRRNYVYYL